MTPLPALPPSGAPQPTTVGAMSEHIGLGDEFTRASDGYWCNTVTGQVEEGMQSPSRDRIGAFATRDEAADALEQVRRNNVRADAAEFDD